jgi:hypothetical protein
LGGGQELLSEDIGFELLGAFELCHMRRQKQPMPSVLTRQRRRDGKLWLTGGQRKKDPEQQDVLATSGATRNGKLAPAEVFRDEKS